MALTTTAVTKPELTARIVGTELPEGVERSRVRAQLLEIPDKLRQASRTYLQRLRTHTDLEAQHALKRAEVFLGGLASKAIEGKNAETRDAELLMLLQKDDAYRQVDEAIKLARLVLTASELELRNLREESAIRIAALNSMISVGVE